jgi:hypothetical protein
MSSWLQFTGPKARHTCRQMPLDSCLMQDSCIEARVPRCTDVPTQEVAMKETAGVGKCKCSIPSEEPTFTANGTPEPTAPRTPRSSTPASTVPYTQDPKSSAALCRFPDWPRGDAQQTSDHAECWEAMEEGGGQPPHCLAHCDPQLLHRARAHARRRLFDSPVGPGTPLPGQRLGAHTSQTHTQSEDVSDVKHTPPSPSQRRLQSACTAARRVSE